MAELLNVYGASFLSARARSIDSSGIIDREYLRSNHVQVHDEGEKRERDAILSS